MDEESGSKPTIRGFLVAECDGCNRVELAMAVEEVRVRLRRQLEDAFGVESVWRRRPS